MLLLPLILLLTPIKPPQKPGDTGIGRRGYHRGHGPYICELTFLYGIFDVRKEYNIIEPLHQLTPPWEGRLKDIKVSPNVNDPSQPWSFTAPLQ